MIGVAAGGNAVGKRLGLVVLGLILAFMAVAGVVAAAHNRHAWGLLPISVALAAGSWRVFRAALGASAPASAREPWYR